MVVAVLLIAGDHVPDIPLFELDGNVSGSPMQIGATGLNVGVVSALIAMVIVVGMAQVGTAVDVGVNV